MNFKIKNFILFFFLIFGSVVFSTDKANNEKYINVLSEVENILEENHFKKNVIVSSNQIKEKFLNSIDSQKTVFTLSNFNELSNQRNFNKENQIEFAFEVFEKFREKSINYLKSLKNLKKNLLITLKFKKKKF